MAVTMEDVRRALMPEEPDFAQAAARLGPAALPFLAEIVHNDRMLGPKAVSLAGQIKDPKAATLVGEAATSAVPAVRVAAAASALHLPSDRASEVILALLDDKDPGVRKVALRSTPHGASAPLRARVAELAQSEQNETLRALSKETHERLAKPAK